MTSKTSTLTTSAKKPATLRRLSTHIWSENSHNASGSQASLTLSSKTSALSFQDSHAEEVEVEASLIAGGLYNASSFASTSTITSPKPRSKPLAAAATFRRRISRDDVQMADSTKTRPSSPVAMVSPLRIENVSLLQSDIIECSQSQSQEPSQDSRRLRRTLSNVSNASTILIDPTFEQCIEKLDKRGIKHHDYGFKRPLSLIPELFDQYEGIAEYEYKLNQHPRSNPITGKVLRRLLACGWVTMDEVQQRCTPADMEELRKFDMEENTYPSNLRFPDHKPLNRRQRLWVMDQKRGLYQKIDKGLDEIRKQEECSRAYARGERRRDKTLHEQWLDEQRARAKARAKEEKEKAKKGKRRFEGEAGGAEVEKGSDSPKRARFSESPSPPPSQQSSPKPRKAPKVWSDEYWIRFRDEHGLIPSEYEKQYPAPRSMYDPEIYSEAVEAFEKVVERKEGEKRVLPERSDTPPLDDESSQSQSQSQSQQRRKPVPLVHPKKAKGLQRGGLTRQQTLLAF
ncbi:hypothetical protein BKA70DRAFT_1294042 [Coprinopsis sp. MPI-PUGE-AT-0042]|nr:hypothetical protein BKA70DRAFT_1294042 [Coprinopsis sp. MPI-PUGE-AT-0042]